MQAPIPPLSQSQDQREYCQTCFQQQSHQTALAWLQSTKQPHQHYEYLLQFPDSFAQFSQKFPEQIVHFLA